MDYKKRAALFNDNEEEEPSYDPRVDEDSGQGNNNKASPLNLQEQEKKYPGMDYYYVNNEENKRQDNIEYDNTGASDVRTSTEDDEDTPSKSNNALYTRQSFQSRGQLSRKTKCSVVNYTIASKKVIYFVKGEDSVSEFDIQRRYSEFVSLRTLLVSRWPGLFIPPLPPKKATGNLEEKFIVERMLYLDHFLKSLELNDTLYNSEEFKVFVRPMHPDIKKSMAMLPKQLTSMLLEKYREEFKIDEYLTEEEFNRHKTNITNTADHIKNNLTFLCELRTNIKNMVAIKDNEINSYMNMCGALCAYEEKVLSVFVEKDESRLVLKEPANGTLFWDNVLRCKEHIINPYNNLFLWIKAEIADQKALNEAIVQRENLILAFVKLDNKKKNDKLELDKLKIGKTTLKTLFHTNKGKLDEVANLNNLIDNEEKELQEYDAVIKIVTVLLSEKVIPQVKVNKAAHYYEMLQTLAKSQLHQSEFITLLWKNIMSSVSLKVL